MHKIVDRNITNIINRIKTNLAVALLDARQVGKSTIAGMIIANFPNQFNHFYLNLGIALIV
jgi:predicted AAA+ superfamily ATPase